MEAIVLHHQLKRSITIVIRGWLKRINAAYSHPELLTSSTVDRWFGMEISYDWGNADNTKNQDNGNILSAAWKSKGDGVRRAYRFTNLDG